MRHTRGLGPAAIVMNTSDLVRLHVVTRVRRYAVDSRRINGLGGSRLLVTRAQYLMFCTGACPASKNTRVVIARPCVTLTVSYSC